MQGWIKLHREVRSNWLFQEKRTFSKFEAWVDLLLEVNHKDNKVLLGNELVEVKRGQTITSIRQLCNRWGWSNTKVKQFFSLLEQDGMLTVKSDTKKTVVTIEKYDFYQCIDDEKTTQKHHDNDTNTTQKHTNKNDKNEKNDKEKDYTSKIKDLLPVFSSIPNFTDLNKRYWNVIRETRTTGKISPSVIYNTMKKWENYDSTVIQYALKTHIDSHKGKDEKYTLGIMRGTSKEDASDRLNRKVVPINKSNTAIDWEAL